MNTKKKIVLSGYYGFDNLGDEALLNYMVSLLKQNDVEPIVLSSNPKRTEKLYEVRSVNRMHIKEVLAAIKESDGLINGGGSLLQDKTSKKSLLYYLGLQSAVKSLGKPFFFYGQGVGPISSKSMRLATKEVLKMAKAISVRDEASQNFLVNVMGLKHDIVDVIHDPVTFFPVSSPKEYLLTKEEQEFLSKGPVFLSLRPTEGNMLLKKEMKKFVESLKEKNIPVITFPFHPEQDREFSKEILAGHDNCLVIDRTIDLETASYIFRKSSVVVGMRLHSLILAASQCTPFVGISYDPKIDAFLSKYNEEAIGNIEDLDSQRLLQETEFALRNKKKIEEELRMYKKNMQHINSEYDEFIMKMIKGE